jgi:hypothetical protein
MNATMQPLAPAPYPQNMAAGISLDGFVTCRACLHPHRAGAKFCGNCGNATAANPNITLPQADVAPLETPSFAHIAQTEIPKELLQELGDLLVLLIRERIFLYVHCTLFVVFTSIGIYTSLKVYDHFLGDEVTRVIISLTPILFINCISLGFIAPIMGTKREIQKLKYRLLLVRHRIEYRALL